MMRLKNLFYLAPVFLFLLLPKAGFAQTAPDSLLHEYLLPVSSYTDLGTADAKKGGECDTAITLDDLSNSATPTSCGTLSTSGDIARSDTTNNYLILQKPASMKYKFNVAQAGDYTFKIQTANLGDNFNNLTNQQVDYLLSQAGIADIKSLIKDSDGLDPSLTNENLARSLIFDVYINGTRKGYMIVPDTDTSTKVQDGSLEVGNLSAGTQEIELRFSSDYYVDFSKMSLPTYFNGFAGVDLDGNKILDTNPVIFTASIDKVQQVEDVIGIRIYTNYQNKYPTDWYKDNVINPNTGIQNITVDGYQGVQDGRTVYVSATNLAQACQGGSKDTKACTTDSDCPDGKCVLIGSVFSNIYVIAYNENATPATTAIYNLMLQNFNFNTNLQSYYPGVYSQIKDQLRRDTIRRADVNYVNKLLTAYHQKNGKFPDLTAGTFVPGHSISTWPSWQASLGNALGSGLPLDPLNYLSTSLTQNDCTGANANSGICQGGTKTCTADSDCTSGTCVFSCKNVCTRDTNGNPLTGCSATQQCVGNQYCSISPLPYDATTGWDKTNLKFAFDTYTSGTSGNCSNNSLIGSFNLGAGTPCNYKGAFVYQYTTPDKGKTYLFNYRLEYQTSGTCQPGQCSVNGQCYNSGQCVSASDHQYCLAGSTQNSCGDGFLQSDCGEDCDGKLGINNACAAIPDILSDGTKVAPNNHNWYTPVSGTCSSDCKIQSPTNLTKEDCGGYCGDDGWVQKDHGETCDSGTTPNAFCVNCRCVPNCKGKCNGVSDGCGGKCAVVCALGQACVNNNCVAQTCNDICKAANAQCGKIGTCICGSETACDSGTQPQQCINNQCVAVTKTCKPDCTNKVCGSDGCNGICGICGIGKKCDDTTGKCVLACKSTCVNGGVASNGIYPCGTDGCNNLNGCYVYCSTYTNETSCNKNSDCQWSDGSCVNSPTATQSCVGYGLLGSAWSCDPLLGQCTCNLAPTDPRACLDRCSGHDACGKHCGVPGQCKQGPCNTDGKYTGDIVDKGNLADRCLICSDYCQAYAGEASYGNCYDYQALNITEAIPAGGGQNAYDGSMLVTVYVPATYFDSNDMADSIRFVDVNDRTKIFPYFVDTACGLSGTKCFDPAGADPSMLVQGYLKVLVRVPSNVSNINMINNFYNAQQTNVTTGDTAGNTTLLPQYTDEWVNNAWKPIDCSTATSAATCAANPPCQWINDNKCELPFNDPASVFDLYDDFNSGVNTSTWAILPTDTTKAGINSRPIPEGVMISTQPERGGTDPQLSISAVTSHKHKTECGACCHTGHKYSTHTRGVWDHAGPGVYWGVQTNRIFAGQYVIRTDFNLPPYDTGAGHFNVRNMRNSLSIYYGTTSAVLGPNAFGPCGGPYYYATPTTLPNVITGPGYYDRFYLAVDQTRYCDHGTCHCNYRGDDCTMSGSHWDGRFDNFIARKMPEIVITIGVKTAPKNPVTGKPCAPGIPTTPHPTPPSCVPNPNICQQKNASCGQLDDGCGTMINCGSCPPTKCSVYTTQYSCNNTNSDCAWNAGDASAEPPIAPSCNSNKTCNDNNQCVALSCDRVASCQGKVCGDDSCGGACGSCPTNSNCSYHTDNCPNDQYCYENEDQTTQCLPCTSLTTDEGDCQQQGGTSTCQVDWTIGDDGVTCVQCTSQNGLLNCGDKTLNPYCHGDCSGSNGNFSPPQVCGDDGCGGTCGKCPAGQKCDQTTDNCPNGTACNNDGTACVCSSVTCLSPNECNADNTACICTPSCTGKCGGPDGCGSQCPNTCPSGQNCGADNVSCTCPSGQKICGTGCISSTSCCTDSDCASGKTCKSGTCQ